MIKQQTMRGRSNPYSSKKKDGGWRLCVDYRAINKITIKDKFPIPTVDEILAKLKGAFVFSKFDLRSGYHQILMNPIDVEKIAFKTYHGHYEFLMVPFGLTNALATFQATMNKIFAPYLRKFVLIFFDDILVFNTSREDHLLHLEAILFTLRENKLYAKQSKCLLLQEKLQFLGHYI